MAEVVTVELRLIEQIFRLSTTVEQRADLERAGQLLNDKFKSFVVKHRIWNIIS